MIEKLYYTSDCKQVVPAITCNQCNRCMGQNLYTDISGIKHCLDCYEYGEVNESIKLYRSVREIANEQHILIHAYELTPKQLQGSSFLLKCYRTKQTGFLQAVCGAGKTEMTYQVILHVLNEQKKICFVLPRVEVLKEVYQRFKTSFPKTTIKMLSQGYKDYDNASLLFSTPQQLIRFYHEFDLVIVDEADAFPYANNELLERITYKSLKRNGIILFMSATITKQFKEKLHNGQISHFTIPSRYHYRDLAVPRILKIKNEQRGMKELIKICNNKLINLRRCIIFVPSKRLGKIILEQIQNNNIKSHFINSSTTNKNRIIKEFKTNMVNILISTTLLERGVTFQDIDCIVLYADHKVFTKSVLIQISGRVGRLKQYPEGEVLFITKQNTKHIKQCIREIQMMNKRNQCEMQAL